MTELLIENLIEDWKETIGLTIISIEDYNIDCDDPIELSVIHFNNGKFVIQRDQSYYTTSCGLVWSGSFNEHLKVINKINTIPPSHTLTCPTCGKIIDMRDLGQVLCHGFMNKETGKFECMTDEEIAALDVQYSSSKKVGDSVEWSKDKKRIDLN